MKSYEYSPYDDRTQPLRQINKYNPSQVRQFFGKVGFQDDERDIDFSVAYVDNSLHGNQTVPVSMLDRAKYGYTHSDYTNTKALTLNLKEPEARDILKKAGALVDGERVRIVLVNDTMMSHPIHLHGMWSDLEDETGAFLVRKHTLDMPPGSRRTFRVTADALGRWAFHCHLLFHMDAGMFREVVVTEGVLVMHCVVSPVFQE